MRIDELIRRLAPGQGPVSAEGLWGSFARILAGIVADRARRPLLLITAHNDEADDCRDDIETVTGTAPDLLPALETLAGEEVEADELVGERLRLCIGMEQGAGNGERGSKDAPPRCIVASIQSLMQPVPSPAAIEAQSLLIEVGQTLDPDQLVRRLDERGCQKCDQVEVPGDFARRGGIVDVFSNAHTDALRVEFFGDEVE
ncbi:MAG: hypothetical protein IID31_14570, partial [Planctomycetes bacterium]|nr:hypothetical protein [Planctomycetota bacterium]